MHREAYEYVTAARHHAADAQTVLELGSYDVNGSVRDLFAGCGGMTLGFKRAGFRPVFAVEHDPDSADTYDLNFGKHVARNRSRPCSIEEVERFHEDTPALKSHQGKKAPALTVPN